MPTWQAALNPRLVSGYVIYEEDAGHWGLKPA